MTGIPAVCSLTIALLAGLLASSTAIPLSLGQTGQVSPPVTPNSPVSGLNESARAFYKSVWGIEILGVRSVSAGTWLRFSYRVLDAKRATVLNEKRWKPRLIDERTGAVLTVPTMDMVGVLRPTAAPQTGRAYYMIFENPGRLVRPGNRVSILVGNFRAEGLVVEGLEKSNPGQP